MGDCSVEHSPAVWKELARFLVRADGPEGEWHQVMLRLRDAVLEASRLSDHVRPSWLAGAGFGAGVRARVRAAKVWRDFVCAWGDAHPLCARVADAAEAARVFRARALLLCMARGEARVEPGEWLALRWPAAEFEWGAAQAALDVAAQAITGNLVWNGAAIAHLPSPAHSPQGRVIEQPVEWRGRLAPMRVASEDDWMELCETRVHVFPTSQSRLAELAIEDALSGAPAAAATPATLQEVARVWALNPMRDAEWPFCTSPRTPVVAWQSAGESFCLVRCARPTQMRRAALPWMRGLEALSADEALGARAVDVAASFCGEFFRRLCEGDPVLKTSPFALWDARARHSPAFVRWRELNELDEREAGEGECAADADWLDGLARRWAQERAGEPQ